MICPTRPTPGSEGLLRSPPGRKASGAHGPHGGNQTPGVRLCHRAAQDVVSALPYADFMDHRDHAATNVVRFESGACWRTVSRGPGRGVDTPPVCPVSSGGPAGRRSARR
jgi:hypothetical protein